MVTMPPDAVRTLASSTVLVKASSRVKRDLAGIVNGSLPQSLRQGGCHAERERNVTQCLDDVENRAVSRA